MNMLQAIVLAIVQGITEFLPISSTAHLILVPWFLAWRDPGLAFDIAVHAGTLVAVLVYFREDWVGLLKSVVRKGNLSQEAARENRHLLLFLMVATLPGALAGLVLKSYAEHEFRHPFVIAGTLIGGALLMWQADRLSGGKGTQDSGRLTLAHALILGSAQALAIVPGVSRAGATITAGLFLGLGRPAAARVSFLMSAPIIGGAVLKTGLDVVREGGAELALWPTLVGVVASGLVGYAVIAWLLRYLEQKTFRIFIIYRILLGVLVCIAGWGLRHHLN